MSYLGIFGLEFQKVIVIFEISTLEFVKNESLTHKMNFGIGSAFSKIPVSAFSEGPAPSPGLPYKVCLFILANKPKFKKHNVVILFSFIPSFFMSFLAHKNIDRLNTSLSRVIS